MYYENYFRECSLNCFIAFVSDIEDIVLNWFEEL
jgi:hypothetical protein